jgi:hypothetical protein
MNDAVKRNPLLTAAPRELERHDWGNLVEGDPNSITVAQSQDPSATGVRSVVLLMASVVTIQRQEF